MKNNPIIITDVDNTIAASYNADGTRRRTVYDWTRVDTDLPILSTITAIIALMEFHNADLHVVTGRSKGVKRDPDICLRLTEEWINLHGLKPVNLHFRENDDYRKSTIVKQELVEKLIESYGSNVVSVFEDDEDVVNMYRQIFGFPVFHVKIVKL